MQPITGFGLKSFRLKCPEVLTKDNLIRGEKPQLFACGNHPHNFYLEILSEGGIIGLMVIVVFFIILLKKSIKNLIEYNRESNKKYFLLLALTITFL